MPIGQTAVLASLGCWYLAIVSQRKAYFVSYQLSTFSNFFKLFDNGGRKINLATLAAAAHRHIIHINNVPLVMEGNTRDCVFN